jgi:hypothetical protein
MFYRSVLAQVLSDLFLELPLLILAWAVWRWWRKSPKVGVPAWGSYLAIGALVLVGFQGLVGIVFSAWAGASGGASYKPEFLRFLRLSELPFIIVSSFLVVVGPPAILIWVVRRWWRTSLRIDTPVWRSYFAIGAIILVGLSVLLRIISGAWADLSGGGGFPDNPVFIWLFGIGFFAAPAGLLASLFGKGTLRWPACWLSALMTFLWIFTTPWDI